jgi:CRISPR-associated endoribonuclease Cas6
MRLNLKLSPNTDPVPYDHLHQMTGALHRWLGWNDVHDTLSLYSFGWLRGGKARDKQLFFPGGASWSVSFYDHTLAKKMIQGIMQEPEAFYGMQAIEIREQAAPSFGGHYRFKTDGGHIVVRRKRPDGGREYLLWEDEAADAALTRLLQRKMEAAGFTDRDVQVRFDRSYSRPRTKLSTIKDVSHRGSECPVVGEGSQEAVRFAWLVGLGEMTGSGFGALR